MQSKQHKNSNFVLFRQLLRLFDYFLRNQPLPSAEIRGLVKWKQESSNTDSNRHLQLNSKRENCAQLAMGD